MTPVMRPTQLAVSDSCAPREAAHRNGPGHSAGSATSNTAREIPRGAYVRSRRMRGTGFPDVVVLQPYDAAATDRRCRDWRPCSLWDVRRLARRRARLPLASLLPGSSIGTGEHAAAASCLRKLSTLAESTIVARKLLRRRTRFMRSSPNRGSRRVCEGPGAQVWPRRWPRRSPTKHQGGSGAFRAVGCGGSGAVSRWTTCGCPTV